MKKHVFAAVVIGVLCIVSVVNVSAQESCNALLQQGIYERIREQGSSSNYSQMRSAICTQYNRLQQDKLKGDVKIGYVVDSSTASFSWEQLDVIGQSMCKSDSSDNAAQNIYNIANDRISAGAVSAWQQCMALQRDGLITESTFREDDSGAMTFSMRYVPPVNVDRYPVVQDIQISPANSFTCAGPLWDARRTMMNSGSLGMVCTRVVSTKPIQSQGRNVYAPSATITVFTSAGNVNRNFVAIPVPPPQASPGVGDIVASLLDEAKFREIHGSGWVLANGQAIPSDSHYARVSGSTYAPNLMGRFLLGASGGWWQPGVSGGSANVTLSIANLPAHDHRGLYPSRGSIMVTLPGASGRLVSNPGGRGWWDGVDALEFITGRTGSNVPFSVMPPYTAVNYFIKIN